MKPIIQEYAINSKIHIPGATIWQQVEDGVSEQAISARTWDGSPNKRMIELKQGDNEILINGETVEELFKMLRRWLKE